MKADFEEIDQKVEEKNPHSGRKENKNEQIPSAFWLCGDTAAAPA